MLRTATNMLLGIAWVGVLLSIAAHGAAIAGHGQIFEALSNYLFLGCFVLWLSITPMIKIPKPTEPAGWRGWRVVLRGSPAYLQTVIWLLFAYSCVWIGLPLFRQSWSSPLLNDRIVSSAFPSLYLAALCILFSLKREQSKLGTESDNGQSYAASQTDRFGV